MPSKRFSVGVYPHPIMHSCPAKVVTRTYAELATLVPTSVTGIAQSPEGPAIRI
jgi:hypothetical protein